MIKVNDLIEVWLPVVWPWVKVIEITDNGFKGRIDNKLYQEHSEHEKAQFMKKNFGSVAPVPKLHDYKYNDIIPFVVSPMDGRWMPEELLEGEAA